MHPRAPRLLLLAAVFLAAAGPLRAQGCAQCRDNLRATPPATQHAYQQAIILLGGTALTLCTVAVLVMRRNTHTLQPPAERGEHHNPR